MIYAGIGARATPRDVLNLMECMGKALAKKGWVLRTGGADGADRAFMRGANKVSPEDVEIFVPYSGYKAEFRHESNYVCSETGDWAFDLAARHHPAWARCSSFARRAHARNNQILFGEHGEDPVEFVVCWTPNAMDVGGTGQALRVAVGYDLLVYNLADAGTFHQIQKRVEQILGW